MKTLAELEAESTDGFKNQVETPEQTRLRESRERILRQHEEMKANGTSGYSSPVSCTHCSGLHCDAEGDECEHCEGTGDEPQSDHDEDEEDEDDEDRDNFDDPDPDDHPNCDNPYYEGD